MPNIVNNINALLNAEWRRTTLFNALIAAHFANTASALLIAAYALIQFQPGESPAWITAAALAMWLIATIAIFAAYAHKKSVLNSPSHRQWKLDQIKAKQEWVKRETDRLADEYKQNQKETNK